MQDFSGGIDAFQLEPEPFFSKIDHLAWDDLGTALNLPGSINRHSEVLSFLCHS